MSTERHEPDTPIEERNIEKALKYLPDANKTIVLKDCTEYWRQ